MRNTLYTFLVLSSLSLCETDSHAQCVDDVEYSSSGNIKKQTKLVGDTCVTSTWYENGQLESQYKELDGVLVNKSLYYCSDGTLVSMFRHNSEQKEKYQTFYCNGQIMADGFYFSDPGCLIDHFTEYYENGKIKKVGDFTTSLNCDEANKKIGAWKYYSEDGLLIKTENYQDGLLINLSEEVKEK